MKLIKFSGNEKIKRKKERRKEESMKKKVLLDIDGVIANFYASFGGFLNKNLGANMQLTFEPPEYNMDNWGHNLSKEIVEKSIQEWIIQNGYLNMSLYPGAKAFVYKLMDEYDVHIVTARVGDFSTVFEDSILNKIKSDTYAWFKKHGIPSDKLFFEHKKTDFCKKYGIPLMIEDKLTNAMSGARNDIYVVLVDRGWNRYHRQKDGVILYRDHNKLIVAEDFDEALEIIERVLG